MDKSIIVDTAFGDSRHLVVRKLSENLYQVDIDGVVRHPNCTAEAVMRALGNYLS